MTKLSDLLIDEVSLVRKGANQHAHVAIAKSADGDTGGTVDPENIFDLEGNPVDVDDLQFGDVVQDEQGNKFEYSEVDDDLSGDEYDLDYDGDNVQELAEVGKALKINGRVINNRAARKAIIGGHNAGVRARSAFGAATSQVGQAGRLAGGIGRSGARSAANGLSTGAGAVRTGAGNVANAARNGAGSAQNAVAGFARTTPRTRKGAQRGILGAGLGGLALGGAGGYGVRKSFEEDMRTELSKALTDDDRDAVISKAFGYMEALEQEVSKAQQMAEAEHDARLDAEYLEVAKSYTLPVDDEDLAYALREAGENLSDESVDIIRKCLEVASQAMEAEYGATGGGDNGDIMNQVDARVESIGKSAGFGDFTREQAVSKLFESDGDAYDQYLLDNPAQLGR